MKRIKEVIVVEGKNDTKRLKTFFDVETIETCGSHLSKKTIAFIKEIHEKRGVILLLDPDSPGERVRNILNQSIPGLKNAFLLKENARTSKKVGVEHASKEVIEEALRHLVSYEEKEETLSMEDFYDLGLMGKEESAHLRDLVSVHFHIGKCNAKTMWKRLNLLGVDKEEIERVIKDE